METKKEHYIMIKGWTYQADITIINASSPKSPKICYAKLTELKGEVENSIIIDGDFNATL